MQPKGTRITPEVVEELRRTRERVMKGRRFEDDSADIIRTARDEITLRWTDRDVARTDDVPA